jgi:hypothetical protein
LHLDWGRDAVERLKKLRAEQFAFGEACPTIV